ncbi:hypothetical protein FO488_06310 [Geobacter sp. FeAm09]|uniref:hypothetical protein n=1 Tax=Geobacter sp. FeAm09 TaxID=2597769 RepID=UPI0011EDB2AD|nr:hypothetical protein [Geobacter sp. FeAm09]QEM67804.1 hypothetical protein FO488_06310 [Geobacter sp. FeAm09]
MHSDVPVLPLYGGMVSVLNLLREASFGQRVAEEEGDSLVSYFVETDHWHRLYSDKVDVIYGQKGTGKSALYSLLVTRRDELFDRGVLLAPGENPRGAPAFRALVTDPPASEREFTALWKLYIVCLVSESLSDYGIPGDAATELRLHLEQSGLREKHRNLQSVLLSAFEYVKRLLRPSAFETETLKGVASTFFTLCRKLSRGSHLHFSLYVECRPNPSGIYIRGRVNNTF